MNAAALEQQFIDAYDLYADAIFRHCAFRLGCRETGKELMQETFLKAWEYIAKGEEVENIRAFLYKVASNLIVDTGRRKSKRHVDSLEDMQETGFDIEESEPGPDRKYSQQEIVDTLHKIDEQYRDAVIMRYIDGLPPKEIATYLGVSANVASVRINRGMKQLQSLLIPDDA